MYKKYEMNAHVFIINLKKQTQKRGAWEAPSVKRLTLDLSSDLHLMVMIYTLT